MTRTFKKIKLHDPLIGMIHLQFNSPPENIIDIEMMKEMDFALTEMQEALECKVLVFSGSGPNFSCGISVDEQQHYGYQDMLRMYYRIFQELNKLGIPTLAMVNGQCMDEGLELAAFCNFVFAERGTTFAIREISMGDFPLFTSLFLPWRVRQGMTDMLALTGGSIPAEEALRVGLVNHVSEPGQMETDAAMFMKEHLFPYSASSLRYANKAGRWYFNKFLDANFKDIEDHFLHGRKPNI
ncbi:enoyl-CoA hydratase/isomerase family protein [Planctomycetota bacterium]